MAHNSRPTRRDILRMTGGAVSGLALLNSPFGALLEAMTRGLVGRAMATEAGITPRRWIDMRFDNAPPRWVYDLFLKPYDGGTDVQSYTQIGARYAVVADGAYTNVEYATTKQKGINCPWIWQFPLPKASGGTRPMADLLDHLLHIRGVNVANPAHQGAQGLHYRPLGAVQSINALAADNSNAPIAALFYGVGNFQFGSLAAKTPVQVASGNLLTNLLSPFLANTSPGYKTNAANVKTYFDAVTDALKSDTLARNPGAVPSVNSLAAARELMTRSFGDLSAVWNGLLNKYNGLIARALDPTVVLAGINDKPVGTSATRGQAYQIEGAIVSGDLTKLITPAAVLPGMAGAFALAEFVALNKLSDSITVGMGTFNGINLVTATGTSPKVINPDEHGLGKMPTLMINSYLARAHAACLLELIDQLVADGSFADTVISVGGEFNRRPRWDAIGSDHAQDGASFAFYSGAVSGPIMLGNTKSLPSNDFYPGTFGVGAPVASAGGMTLDLASIAASTATLLRTPSPVTARGSLLRETDDGQIEAAIEPAKNV